jgi:hypothetical protein
LRVAKLALAGRGNWWSKITCKKGPPYSEITVHLRLAPVDPLAPVDVRFRRAGLPGFCPAEEGTSMEAGERQHGLQHPCAVGRAAAHDMRLARPCCSGTAACIPGRAPGLF